MIYRASRASGPNPVIATIRVLSLPYVGSPTGGSLRLGLLVVHTLCSTNEDGRLPNGVDHFASVNVRLSDHVFRGARELATY